MSATSGSTPEAGSSFTMGRQRTRNAQAQADLRVRRKAYIKTLEETVSSLEACVRQLRDQNAELTARASASASASASTNSFSDSELEELRAENARLYAVLAQAGLAAGPSSSSSASARPRTNAGPADGEQERGWNHTSSITTKKRKVSKMQAFAKDVGYQLDGTHSSTLPAQKANHTSALITAEDRSTKPTHSRFDSMASNTPSSSSRESVVSHRSPSTPGFEMADAVPPESAPKIESIDMLHLPAASLDAVWPVYAPSMTLESTPTATQMFTQDVAPQTTVAPTQAQRADLATWLLHQHAHAIPSTAHAQWLLAQEPSSSASIRDCRSFPARSHRRLTPGRLLRQSCLGVRRRRVRASPAASTSWNRQS